MDFSYEVYFVGIISRIIGDFKEFLERIIGIFKSIIDLSLQMIRLGQSLYNVNA